MRQKIWIAVVLCCIVLLGGGVYLATDKPVAQTEPTILSENPPAPEQSPVDQPAATSVSECPNYCPTGTCNLEYCGPLTSVPYDVDHNVRCCIYQGTTYTCSGYNTIHQAVTDCDTSGEPGLCSPHGYGTPFCAS